MNASDRRDVDLEKRLSGGLLDVFIRAGLVFAMAVLCYQVFSPFVSLMAWALILAVALYPVHQKLADKMGRRQGLAATLLVLVGIVLIVGATLLALGYQFFMRWVAAKPDTPMGLAARQSQGEG